MTFKDRVLWQHSGTLGSLCRQSGDLDLTFDLFKSSIRFERHGIAVLTLFQRFKLGGVGGR